MPQVLSILQWIEYKTICFLHAHLSVSSLAMARCVKKNSFFFADLPTHTFIVRVCSLEKNDELRYATWLDAEQPNVRVIHSVLDASSLPADFCSSALWQRVRSRVCVLK